MTTIPLFPLRHALFPDGVLHLQIFEVRYLHMVRRCVEEGASFGVVGLLAGNEVRTPEGVEELANAGTLARIQEWEIVMPGLMRISCVGTKRFRLHSSYEGQYGLWMGEVEFLADDPALPLQQPLQRSADLLGRLIADLQEQGSAAMPIAPPYRLDDSAWVANRLCELLPLSMECKQELLCMPDPVQRLAWVDRWLEERGGLG